MSDSSMKCITDVEAMTGHILPLVAYALQIYLISQLFSFTGKYSHILTDIFWVVALLVFIMIAIAFHGSGCLYLYTWFIMCLTDFLLFALVFYLLSCSDRQHISCENHNTYRNQGLPTNNQDRETTITIPVS
jgi:hypothetical protein